MPTLISMVESEGLDRISNGPMNLLERPFELCCLVYTWVISFDREMIGFGSDEVGTAILLFFT